jgi:hypothetical protein
MNWVILFGKAILGDLVHYTVNDVFLQESMSGLLVQD